MNKKSAFIRTVSGDIKPQELGWCQAHEHVYVEAGGLSIASAVSRIDDFDKSLQELLLYKKAVYNKYSSKAAIVDAQPTSCGGNIDALRKLSEASGVAIIASTGFHRRCFYDKELQESFERLRDKFIEDINVGAGVIKVAFEGFDDAYLNKLHKAAAAAAAIMRVPVLCHLQGGNPLEFIEFYSRSGVCAKQLIICHADRFVPELMLHKEALKTGAYLEYDTIARPKYHDDIREIEIAMCMIEAGFERQLLFGLDMTRERMSAYGGSVGLDYIVREFGKLLPREYLTKIMIDNPAEALAGV